MTLEEAKKLADNGNANAMMALVNYYSDILAKDSDNEEAGDLLSEYLERAANAGHTDAIIKMAESSYNAAKIMIEMISQLGRDDSWEGSLETAYKWAIKLLHLLESFQGIDEAKQIAHECFIDSIVWLSVSYYLSDNLNGIIRITEGVDSPIVKALHGLALYEYAETVAEMENAFHFLKNAMHPTFLSDRYSTPKLIEAARWDICSRLSYIYRALYKDNDSAYNVLSTILEHTEDPKFQQSIREDMSHYHKNFFGRYNYVD